MKTITVRKKPLKRISASKKKAIGKNGKDISASYNQFKEFNGKQYTGMTIGRSHKWNYDKGEWKETKITDPKSPYKMKYEITQVIDVLTEMKQGNKAMKELFGFDLDKLTGILDPTNPQSGMAGATGTRAIRVTIWSPYEK